MKFCVIGLGRFGYNVATTLGEHGIDVLAVDSNETIVSAIRDNVTQAICMRVRDESSLRSIGVDEMETVVVAIGDDFAASVLITALLKKRLKIAHVVARAINDIHKEILQLTGADEVILPEQEVGIRVAGSLSTSLTELARIGKDFSISEIEAPAAFVGKRLAELHLVKNYQVVCLGLKEGAEITLVESSHVIRAQEKLVIAGRNKNIERINNR